MENVEVQDTESSGRETRLRKRILNLFVVVLGILAELMDKILTPIYSLHTAKPKES
jgi:hypothetical protein